MAGLVTEDCRRKLRQKITCPTCGGVGKVRKTQQGNWEEDRVHYKYVSVNCPKCKGREWVYPVSEETNGK